MKCLQKFLLSLSLSHVLSFSMNFYLFMMPFAFALSLDEINKNFQLKEENIEEKYQQKIQEAENFWLSQIPLAAPKSKGKNDMMINHFQKMKEELGKEYKKFGQEKLDLYNQWYAELLKAHVPFASNAKEKARAQIEKWYQEIVDFNEEHQRDLLQELTERVHGLQKRWYSQANQGCGEGNGPIDLRSPGQSMEHVKIRSQHQLNNCYSQAAVQLFDSYFKSQRLLPADFHSSGYRLSLLNKDEGFGSICKAVNNLLQYGSCDQKFAEDPLEAALARYSSDTFQVFDQQLSKEFEDNRQLRNKAQKIFQFPKDGFSNSRQQELLTDLSANLCGRWKKLHMEEFFPEYVPLHQLTESLIRNLLLQHKPQSSQALKKILFQCAPEQIFSPQSKSSKKPLCQFKERSFLSAGENEKMLKDVHELLNRSHPQPVALGVCGALLQKGRGYHGLSRSAKNLFTKQIKQKGTRLAFFIKKEDCIPHSLLITGRREIGGVCQLKVTNSWGSSCRDYYHSDWQKDCQNGEIWMDQHDLMRNTFSLNWMD